MTNFSDYMQSIFAPLATAAQRGDLVDKLRTSDLPESRRKTQYLKLKELTAVGDGAFPLMDGRFFTRLIFGTKLYICVHVEGITGTEIDEVIDGFSIHGAIVEDLDESTFLTLTQNAPALYKPKRANLIGSAALDIVSLAEEDDYKGHDIYDVIDLFEEILVLSLPATSVFTTCSEWYIAAYLGITSSSFRSRTFPESLLKHHSDLLSLTNVNPENIYFSLTSIHHRQRYLELYKCLEAIHYLPWVKRLKSEHGFTADGLTLARQLRAVRWRRNEAESMKELFNELPEAFVKRVSLKSVSVFAALNYGEVDKKTFGRIVYKIRNIVVHQEDFDEPEPVSLSQDCWLILMDYMASVVYELYKNNMSDTQFKFGAELGDDSRAA